VIVCRNPYVRERLWRQGDYEPLFIAVEMVLYLRGLFIQRLTWCVRALAICFGVLRNVTVLEPTESLGGEPPGDLPP
jgi:hypothetical protein